MTNHIVGLDIGSSSIKAAVGDVGKDGRLSVLDLVKFSSSGVRKGVVYDISDLTQSLSPVITLIKGLSKSATSNIYLGVGSSDTKVQSSIGVVAVSRADYEIYEDDIRRAVQSAQAVNIPPNRLVLHSVVKEYVVDGVRDIRDPLGMVGNRLEVNSLIIDAFTPSIKNLSKCVEMLGGGINGLILGVLAVSRAVLTKNQKELGVVLIDIGFGKTSICVYEENKLLHAAVFPVGSGNITNDLAIGLKVPTSEAEAIKVSFGNASLKDVALKEAVDLAKINPKLKGSVSKRFITEIIEMRLAEIFELVDNELKRLGVSGKLPGGAVLTGGGAKLPGVVDLAKQELKLSTQIGLVEGSNFDLAGENLEAKFEDPEFVSALGLMLLGYDRVRESKKIDLSLGGVFKKIFSYFKP